MGPLAGIHTRSGAGSSFPWLALGLAALAAFVLAACVGIASPAPPAGEPLRTTAPLDEPAAAATVMPGVDASGFTVFDSYLITLDELERAYRVELPGELPDGLELDSRNISVGVSESGFTAVELAWQSGGASQDAWALNLLMNAPSGGDVASLPDSMIPGGVTTRTTSLGSVDALEMDYGPELSPSEDSPSVRFLVWFADDVQYWLTGSGIEADKMAEIARSMPHLQGHPDERFARIGELFSGAARADSVGLVLRSGPEGGLVVAVAAAVALGDVAPGDVIVAIEGVAARGVGARELAARLDGPKGEPVTLSIDGPDVGARDLVIFRGLDSWSEVGIGEESVPPVRSVQGAASPSELAAMGVEGRIILFAGDDLVSQAVFAVDPPTGDVSELWRSEVYYGTGRGSLRTQDALIVFHEWTSVVGVSSFLVARPLAAGRLPRVIREFVFPTQAEAGHVAPPRGDVAYGLRTADRPLYGANPPSREPVPGERFELHVVSFPPEGGSSPATDLIVWQTTLSELGDHVTSLELVGWHETSARAVVSMEETWQTSETGGETKATLLWIDTEAGEVRRRVPVGTARAPTSPDGRWVPVLMLAAGGGEFALFDASRGELVHSAGEPDIWSPDSDWYAWIDKPVTFPREVDAISLRTATVDGGRVRVLAPSLDGSVRLLAVSPDGSLLLVASVATDQPGANGLDVYPVQGGSPLRLPWVQTSAHAVYWVP